MIKNKIEILSDIEHVRRRPNMYIGSVALEYHKRFLNGEFVEIEFVPGLIKLVDEILDNSIDEAIRTDFKYANVIDVVANQTTIKISDNGRGIPQDNIITPEGDTIPSPVAAWTKTKAGGNFGDDSERKTGGQNGVGSALTNIFSKEFIGTTCDGKKKIIVRCANGAEDVSWKFLSSKNNGTQVEFTPDFSHFSVDNFSKTDLSIIEYRLATLSVVYPKIKFSFNGVTVGKTFKEFSKGFDNECELAENSNCSIAICRSPDGFRQLSYVNNINTVNGGTHIDYAMDELSNILIPAIKKKHSIEINKSKIKESLTVIMVVRDMKNIRFDSQTKERLTSPLGEVKGHIDIDFDKLAKNVLKNDEIITPIIEAALARKMAADKAAQTKANKKAQKAVVTKHIKPLKYGIKNSGTSIFIAEGDSAINFLAITRDEKLHGGFPLRGKVLNTWGMLPSKQLANKEIFELVSILGLEYGKDPDMLYDYINIMCDNDFDGRGSIYPTLLGFFSQWPKLFSEGRVRWVKTPIIIASKTEDDYADTKWFYSIEDYKKASGSLGKYKHIRYIKGLGSLVKEEYSRVVNEPELEQVVLDKEWKDKLEMLLGDESDKRKEWMGQ